MQRQIGKYLLERKLGNGQFGDVYLALDSEESNKPYAMKVIQKSKVEVSPLLTRLFESEVSVMKSLKHPNLLHLYDLLETSNNYYMVTQFCDGGDLEQHVNKAKHLSVQEAVFFLKQILCGFVELHSKKIMHRDFKLANVFIHQGQAIIGDFGFAKAGESMTNTRLGTPYNMAPELLLEKKKPYSSKADIWAIGIAFYQMLFGKLPFPATTLAELEEMVSSCSGRNLAINPNFNIPEDIQWLLR